MQKRQSLFLVQNLDMSVFFTRLCPSPLSTVPRSAQRLFCGPNPLLLRGVAEKKWSANKVANLILAAREKEPRASFLLLLFRWLNSLSAYELTRDFNEPLSCTAGKRGNPSTLERVRLRWEEQICSLLFMMMALRSRVERLPGSEVAQRPQIMNEARDEGEDAERPIQPRGDRSALHGRRELACETKRSGG